MHPLQDILDPITREELRRIGITAGQHALDVGAGAGSIAASLCDLVGPAGKVTAIDIDTSLLNPSGILDVYQRDLRTQPLPVDAGSVDVAVARCLLEHLPNRRALLQEMITTLRPGGWLILGEIVYAPVIAHAPRTADSDLIVHVVHGILDVLSANGVDLHWGDKTPAILTTNGLEQVRTRWTAETWTGGSPGCRLLADNARQLHHKLLHEGLTHTDLDHFAVLMTDPAVLVRGYQFASTTARKPAAMALPGQPSGLPHDHGTTVIAPPSPRPNPPAGDSFPGAVYARRTHRERRPDDARSGQHGMPVDESSDMYVRGERVARSARHH
ncbi:methyltransferase domain-containing protein [Micromonospora sagamiensis]|uniref:methyltransferase domain-containing protein n=1 Tax=Micromonospora sagamiensis TaxID=47875 RepID=UPI0016471A69|nr:methyltransferase domain-containing protein [Micromonospora sagamiensis]